MKLEKSRLFKLERAYTTLFQLHFTSFVELSYRWISSHIAKKFCSEDISSQENQPPSKELQCSSPAHTLSRDNEDIRSILPYIIIHFTCNVSVTYLIACLLTYLLTYSMVQSPSWEANWFAASQEIPRISRNAKVHYRTHKRPPPLSIMGQPNPVHIPTSHLLEILPNIIHTSTPRSPQWSSSLRFPHQVSIHPPQLTHTRHMPSPSNSSRFYHPHNIGWGLQII